MKLGSVAAGVAFGLPDLVLGDVDFVVYHDSPRGPLFPTRTFFLRHGHLEGASKFTLTYGLRYELFAPLIDRNNQTSNFSPANGGEIITAASNASGWFDRALIHPDLNNFAPRFGFAYQMLPRLVWRGGYGVFYQHEKRIGSEALLQLNPP